MISIFYGARSRLADLSSVARSRLATLLGDDKAMSGRSSSCPLCSERSECATCDSCGDNAFAWAAAFGHADAAANSGHSTGKGTPIPRMSSQRTNNKKSVGEQISKHGGAFFCCSFQPRRRRQRPALGQCVHTHRMRYHRNIRQSLIDFER